MYIDDKHLSLNLISFENLRGMKTRRLHQKWFPLLWTMQESGHTTNSIVRSHLNRNILLPIYFKPSCFYTLNSIAMIEWSFKMILNTLCYKASQARKVFSLAFASVLKDRITKFEQLYYIPLLLQLKNFLTLVTTFWGPNCRI